MLVREQSAERFNQVLNHPEVRPWVGNDEDGVIDVSRVVDNPSNVLLAGEFGGCCFIRVQPGIYEVHSAFLPEGRGQYARATMKEAVRLMFTGTDAFEILTRVPHGHLPAKMATIDAGGVFQFTRFKECKFLNRITDVNVYATQLQDWILRSAEMAEVGHWVHDRMHAEAARLGIDVPPHDDDDNHNRFVGAAFEMARLGMLQKGCLVYNRWAAVCRHALIEPIALDPPTIRFDIGLMVLRGNDIEIVQPC